MCIRDRVVTWLRAGRHRDLNHYENFIGFHRAIHRYVEPITAAPFSEKTMDGYLGPVIVGVLRNAKQIGNKQIGKSPHSSRPHHKGGHFIPRNWGG